MFTRSSGILLHPTSLPGKYGIGTLGEEAIKFIDFLEKSNQKLWQIFPLGPTGYGDSPYQCFSAFAGNPYLIDFEELFSLNFLDKSDVDNAFLSDNDTFINYGLIYENKLPLLRKAYNNYKNLLPDAIKYDFESFKIANLFWLEDYSLFISTKNKFNGNSWSEWDDDIKNRNPETIERYKLELVEEIDYQQFIQFFFFRQWKRIKEYANSKGIKIVGDIPIFVAFDSADAWSNPELFLFDKDRKPFKVAGVPPDYFSETGQLWGNPLYDWDAIKKDNYTWWIDRVKFNLNTCDIIRIDHFRGFDSYWAVPAEDDTAINGTWEKGPGMDLFNAIKNELGDLPIIAEDLGSLTPSVIQLREDSTFPGMKILQFAFDSGEENDYLPHTYDRNSVVYTGTHDNDTIVGWYSKAKAEDKKWVKDYLDLNDDTHIHWNFIKSAWSSVANIAIAPIQDFLGLGGEARINTPGVAAGNWQWRLSDDVLTDELAEKISYITRMYGR